MRGDTGLKTTEPNEEILPRPRILSRFMLSDRVPTFVLAAPLVVVVVVVGAANWKLHIDVKDGSSLVVIRNLLAYTDVLLLG